MSPAPRKGLGELESGVQIRKECQGEWGALRERASGTAGELATEPSSQTSSLLGQQGDQCFDSDSELPSMTLGLSGAQRKSPRGIVTCHTGYTCPKPFEMSLPRNQRPRYKEGWQGG
jgi:hypothetical protein